AFFVALDVFGGPRDEIGQLLLAFFVHPWQPGERRPRRRVWLLPTLEDATITTAGRQRGRSLAAAAKQWHTSGIAARTLCRTLRRSPLDRRGSGGHSTRRNRVRQRPGKAFVLSGGNRFVRLRE